MTDTPAPPLPASPPPSSSSSPPDPIIGIDLGTTNSLVAVCDAAGPRILESPTGRRLLPSIVRISPVTGQPEAIGDAARDHAVEHPGNTVYSAKRLMGRSLGDVADQADHLAYRVVAGDHHTARIAIGDHVLAPQQISAMILSQLRDWAQAALGGAVSKAVVTVPAYFDDAQRQATRDAGRIAGIEIVRIVNEPTAAALAYGLGNHTPGSIPPRLTQPPQAPGSPPPPNSTVSLSTKLNPSACASPETPLPTTTPQNTRDASEAPPPKTSGAPRSGGAAQGNTSEGHDVTASISQGKTSGGGVIAVFDLGGGTFDVSILRLQVTEAGSVDQVLATAGDTHLGGDDVDRMIIAMIQREITERFFDGQAIDFPPATRQAFRRFAEAAKIRLSTEDTAELVIEIGPGQTYQRTLTRDELEAMMTPWLDRALACCTRALKSAGLETGQIDRVIMVGGSTRIPQVRQRVADLFGSEPYTALNPDEVVALGAAVQASILAGINRDRLLLDVIPLSLGIETMGGAIAKLIMANQTIPARATEQFTTYAEGQTNVKIHVLQGERELVKDCRSLGQFDLTGIPPMPAGLPKLEVTFLVDANGILSVRAVELRSGKRATLQIVPNHGLTRDEVDRMEAASYEHAAQDMNAHRLIDLAMNARLDIRHIRKQLDNVADEIDNTYRDQIQTHIAAVEVFIDAGPAADADTFHQAMTDMDHATIRLAELNITKTLKNK